MQNLGHGLWSQDLCSETINVTPPAPRVTSVTFSYVLLNSWDETDRVSPKNCPFSG